MGRTLEDLGYWWFEEPVQHYHIRAMGEVTRALDITVSAGEQTYTLPALNDLITAGVRMVQPDIVKMGGITGLLRCAALAHGHGVELVPIRHSQPLGIRRTFTLSPRSCKGQSRWNGMTHLPGPIRYSKILPSRTEECSTFQPGQV